MKEYKDARYAALAELKREANKKPEGQASFNAVYRDYKNRALKLEIPFEIDEEQFRTITSQNCVYCGVEPLQHRKHGKKTFNGFYLHNGLDRVDNSKGYTPDNVVACCGICNKAKRDLPLEEFQAWIDRLVAYQRIKNAS